MRAEPEMNHQQNDDHQHHQRGEIFCVHRGWSGMLRNHRLWPPADTCLARIAFHFSRFSFAQTFWRSLRHRLEQIILRGCGRSIPTSRPHWSHGFGMSEYANQDFLWQRYRPTPRRIDDARDRRFPLPQSFLSNQNTAQLFQLTQAFVSFAQDLLCKIAYQRHRYG